MICYIDLLNAIDHSHIFIGNNVFTPATNLNVDNTSDSVSWEETKHSEGESIEVNAAHVGDMLRQRSCFLIIEAKAH